MEDAISGIPLKILSNSFPGIHSDLFKFLFRNDPIVQLTRVNFTLGKYPVKQPESLLDRPIKVELEDSKILDSDTQDNYIHLGEIQISDNVEDVKVKLEDFDLNNSSFEKLGCTKDATIDAIKQERGRSKGTATSKKVNVKKRVKVGKVRGQKEKDSATDKPLNYTCRICNKTIKYLYHFKVHEKNHSISLKDRERPFKCTEEGCNKTFLEKNQFNRHINLTHYPNSKQAIKHMNKINSEGTFVCMKCDKKMTTYKSYMNHIGHCEPNQMCEFCPKIFHNKCTLAKHRNIHTKERKYECLQCDSVFYKAEGLHQHRKFHVYSKERQFPCNIKGCSKAFITNAQLNGHVKICHTQCKDIISCLYCPKKLTGKDSLRYHLKSVHKMEVKKLPFGCDFEGCEQSFTSPVWLEKHQKSKHEPKKHLCSKCGKSFSSFIKCNNHELELKCKL